MLYKVKLAILILAYVTIPPAPVDAAILHICPTGEDIIDAGAVPTNVKGTDTPFT